MKFLSFKAHKIKLQIYYSYIAHLFFVMFSRQQPRKLCDLIILKDLNYLLTVQIFLCLPVLYAAGAFLLQLENFIEEVD
jgi:hypothetical protein